MCLNGLFTNAQGIVYLVELLASLKFLSSLLHLLLRSPSQSQSRSQSRSPLSSSDPPPPERDPAQSFLDLWEPSDRLLGDYLSQLREVLILPAFTTQQAHPSGSEEQQEAEEGKRGEKEFSSLAGGVLPVFTFSRLSLVGWLSLLCVLSCVLVYWLCSLCM